MIDDPDIWRSANLLVKRHGSDTALMCGLVRGELLADGDPEGCAVRKRILYAADEFRIIKPAKG